MDKRYRFVSLLCAIILFCITATGMAQKIPKKDVMDEYLQVLRINGTIPAGLSSGQYEIDYIPPPDTLAGHPWQERNPPLVKTYSKGLLRVAPYDMQLQNYWQSMEPGGRNDGAVWQGRGFTSALTGGIFARYGILSVSIRPSVIYTQNRSFELSPYTPEPGLSPYAYPLGDVDWPQRFGDGSFWRLDPGASYLRLDYKGWTTGISNETMWWSPARQNAIVLSNNAPGFRHFFIGISEPKDIYIGYLESKLFWGKLLESDYFDSDPVNDERYITGGRVAFTPKPIPGLTLGVNRVFYETIPPEGIPVGDLFKLFEAFTKVKFSESGNRGGNDESDQLMSLFGNWIFPESGLEIYAEWARTDHSWNWRDFITEPEHSRGYTLGMQKVFQLPENRLLSANIELTQLETSKTGAFRANPTFYYHYRSTQGYTNRGQILGASIGPGSNSLYMGTSLYFGKGKIEMWGQRVALNNDFLYQNTDLVSSLNTGTSNQYWLHNIEMRFGTGFTYFYKELEAGLGLTLRRELNDDYLYKNDQTHVGLNFSLRYRLSSLR